MIRIVNNSKLTKNLVRFSVTRLTASGLAQAGGTWDEKSLHIALTQSKVRPLFTRGTDYESVFFVAYYDIDKTTQLLRHYGLSHTIGGVHPKVAPIKVIC